MPDPYVVRPDTEFLGRILAQGGEDAKKCYQCATCSVVCELSDGGPAFPRKEMVWAQWGLKDRLMADPDVWLCHRCNDCSTHCPRGARPGDVMAAIRREHVFHYAFPGFLARWLNQPKLLPLMLLIPAVLLGLAFMARESVQGALGASTLSTSRIIYSYSVWFPHWLLIGFFLMFSGLALLAVVIGVGRFWGALKAADARNGTGMATKGLFASIVSTFKLIFTHQQFNRCSTEQRQFLTHAYVFYGFLATFLVSMWTMTASWNPLISDTFVYPYNFFSPWRMLGNIGGLAILIGCLMLIWARLSGPGEGKRAVSSSTYFDWAFVGTLLLVVVTGFASEVLHYARLEPHRHFVYFIHLLFVLSLLMYLPYSKFAHMVYRTTAMVYADYTGRMGTVPASSAPAAVEAPLADKALDEGASAEATGDGNAGEEPPAEEAATDEPENVQGEDK
jgi:quinone-modifying oxidoreductase subunit QmoC